MTSKFRKILSSTIAGSLLICSVIGSTMSVSAATASKYEYSVTDSTQLQKYLVRLGDLTDIQKVLYDIDKNGELTITDATNLRNIAVFNSRDESIFFAYTKCDVVFIKLHTFRYACRFWLCSRLFSRGFYGSCSLCRFCCCHCC